MMDPDMRKGPVNRFGEGTDGVNECGNADWGVAAGVAATRLQGRRQRRGQHARMDARFQNI